MYHGSSSFHSCRCCAHTTSGLWGWCVISWIGSIKQNPGVWVAPYSCGLMLFNLLPYLMLRHHLSQPAHLLRLLCLLLLLLLSLSLSLLLLYTSNRTSSACTSSPPWASPSGCTKVVDELVCRDRTHCRSQQHFAPAGPAAAATPQWGHWPWSHAGSQPGLDRGGSGFRADACLKTLGPRVWFWVNLQELPLINPVARCTKASWWEVAEKLLPSRLVLGSLL